MTEEIFGHKSKGFQDQIFEQGKALLVSIKPKWVAGELVRISDSNDPAIFVACGKVKAIVLIYDRGHKQWREVEIGVAFVSDWKEGDGTVREEGS